MAARASTCGSARERHRLGTGSRARSGRPTLTALYAYWNDEQNLSILEVGTFERLQASDAEIVREPTEQPYGVRDCGVRDPAGNMIRIQEVR